MHSTLSQHAMAVPVLVLACINSGCREKVTLPPLLAAGWINGSPLSEEGLEGNVVVLDFFATWCGPCRESTPELMELYLKYREQGVQFVGLTDEDSSQVELIQNYVDDLGIRWPVGFHASGPSAALRVEALPTVMVFDHQGQLTYQQVGYEPESKAIEQAIQSALDAKQ